MTKLTMPSFSSISLANTKVKFTLFTFAFALAFVLYWPAMQGYPIWDDISYWFFDPVMFPSFPYLDIWKNFSWPLSVSTQKLLFSLLGDKYWVYHLINFVIHCFNAWMVYHFLILLRLRRSYAFIGFLFFLIQPASVITVAWMIQFKTLMCFSLAMGAIIFFMRARHKKDYVIASILFLLSVLSKSSALPLPMVLVFLLGKNWKTKKILTVIPFFMISLFGAYQISKSNLAREAIESAAKVTEKGVTETVAATTPEPVTEILPEPVVESVPEPVKEKPVTADSAFTMESIMEDSEVTEKMFSPPSDEPMVKTEDITPPGVNYDEQAKNKQIVEPTLSLEVLSPFKAYGRLMIKTLHYYFWQAYVPVDNAPVKGLNPFPPGFQDYLHLAFLIILVFITWGTTLFPILVSAHLFLLPYLGLVPAPYMNVTWVSDQHLYLALPSFILLFLGLIERVKSRWVLLPVFMLLIMFAVKTREASGYYRHHTAFYEKSIDSNHNNIPIVYNLSIMYIASGKNMEAKNLLETIISAAEDEPYLKDNRYFPFLVELHGQINQPAPVK